MNKSLEDFRARCPGVLGSWIVDDKGKPEEQDLAPMIDVDVQSITDQLCDVYLAMESFRTGATIRDDGDFDRDITLGFDTINLLARPVAGGLLVILAEDDANLTKVRAMSKLLMRRIGRRSN